MRRVAIPIADDKLSEHFGRCSYYKIFEIDKGNIKSNSVKLPQDHDIKSLPGWVAKQGITDVIVHKIDKGIISLFAGNKINLYVGIPVKSPWILIEDYLKGNLRSDKKIIKEITEQI